MIKRMGEWFEQQFRTSCTHDVQRYLDGELTADEERAFEARMEQSPELAAQVQRRRETIESLRALPGAVPPPHVWLAVQSAIRAEAKPARPPVELPIYRWQWKLAPVAAMVLVAWGSIAFWQNSSTPSVQIIEVVEANGFGAEAELLVAHHDLEVGSADMRRSLSMLYPESPNPDE